MRGLPGAGKTAYVDTNYPYGYVCSNNNFCTVHGAEKPVYIRDESNTEYARKYCLLRYLHALQFQMPDLIVDNTNSMLWEMSPYVLLAQAYDRCIKVIEIYKPPTKNTAHIAGNWEPIPDNWNINVQIISKKE